MRKAALVAAVLLVGAIAAVLLAGGSGDGGDGWCDTYVADLTESNQQAGTGQQDEALLERVMRDQARAIDECDIDRLLEAET